MKILIGIPCLYNGEVCKEAIQSILNRVDITVLILDNGADQEVKTVIENFKEYPNVIVFHEPINIYVNMGWNKFIKYFINHPEYDHLVLMNSDLLLNHDFHRVLKNIWQEYPELCLIPNMVDKDTLKLKVNVDSHLFTVVEGGVPGVFITMSRKQAKYCYPIPSEILLWWGDTYIYSLINAVSGKGTLCIVDTLTAHHIGSETIKRLPEMQEILDKDAENWKNIVEPQMQEKIKSYQLTYKIVTQQK